MCSQCCREIVRVCLLCMFVFIVFSVLLVFGPVLPASALPPSFSSCLLPTLLIPIYCHVPHLCLIVPAFLLVDLDSSSLPSCATLSFVKMSIVAPRGLFFMFSWLSLGLFTWICSSAGLDLFAWSDCLLVQSLSSNLWSLALLCRTLSA